VYDLHNSVLQYDLDLHFSGTVMNFCVGRGSSQVGMLPEVMLDISCDITSKCHMLHYPAENVYCRNIFSVWKCCAATKELLTTFMRLL